MQFFKPKIIIEKKYKYLRIDKKVNFQKILKSIILLGIFIIILKYIILVISKYELYSFAFFTSLIIIFSSFLFLLFFIKNLLLTETLEMDAEKIIIKKNFLFCYYSKEIIIKEIVRITYQKWGFIQIINNFTNRNNSIIIQANTGLEEDEEFFFGTDIDLKIYGVFQNSLKEILGEECKRIEFIYSK